jgi:hypothetical protein
MVGRRTQLPTLLVFFALLGGFDAFGPVGLIVGPLMLTVFLTLVEIYRDRYQPFLLPSPLTSGGPAAAVTDGDGPGDASKAPAVDRTRSEPAADAG